MASKRGFASMSAEKRSEISRKGGEAAHDTGAAHEFTSEEAREAGRKGGRASCEAKARKRAEEAAAMQRIKTVTLPVHIEAIDVECHIEANEETIGHDADASFHDEDPVPSLTGISGTGAYVPHTKETKS